MNQINLQRLVSAAENNIKVSLSDIKEFEGFACLHIGHEFLHALEFLYV